MASPPSCSTGCSASPSLIRKSHLSVRLLCLRLLTLKSDFNGFVYYIEIEAAFRPSESEILFLMFAIYSLIFFTARVAKRAKVMISQACVTSTPGGGGGGEHQRSNHLPHPGSKVTTPPPPLLGQKVTTPQNNTFRVTTPPPPPSPGQRQGSKVHPLARVKGHNTSRLGSKVTTPPGSKVTTPPPPALCAGGR